MMGYIILYIYKRKIFIDITCVGLASARPNNEQVNNILCVDPMNNSVPPSFSPVFQYKYSHFQYFACIFSIFQYFTKGSIYDVCT